jgi:DNA-binding XRE family transcriptional regulator
MSKGKGWDLTSLHSLQGGAGAAQLNPLRDTGGRFMAIFPPADEPEPDTHPVHFRALTERLPEWGRAVQMLREEADLSTLQLAVRMGYTASAIRKIEGTTNNPQMRTLVAVAQALGVKPWDLVRIACCMGGIE